MIRRIFGVLMLVTLLAPAFFAGAGFILARDTLTEIEAVTDTRLERIRRELDDVTEVVESARVSLIAASTLLNRATDTIGDAIEAVADFNARLTFPGIVLTDFVLDLRPVLGTFTIVIPDIPSVNLTIPGLNAIRTLLGDAFDGVNEVINAVESITNLRRIPPALQQAVVEVRTLADEIGAIWSSKAESLRLVLTAIGLWLLIVYVVALYFGLRTAWKMITGK